MCQPAQVGRQLHPLHQALCRHINNDAHQCHQMHQYKDGDVDVDDAHEHRSLPVRTLDVVNNSHCLPLRPCDASTTR